MKDLRNNSLYLPEMEKDACGIGFVANLKGVKSHDVVEDALIMLQNMEHRGACGCDPETGDGAGILIQIPHQYLLDACRKIHIDLPAPGTYGAGVVFFPLEESVREACRERLYEIALQLDLEILGFRKIPISNTMLGASAKSVELHYEQIFLTQRNFQDQDTLERKLFVFRMNSTHSIGSTTRGRSIAGNNYDFYWASLSTKTIVYKGQLRTDQLRMYYPELQDPRVESALALVHSRFSTNTFPKWKLAQPFRFIAHNGEINTIRGNVNWMKSKQALFESDLFTKEEFDLLLPVCDKAHSDSANLDAIVEMLVLDGRSLPHAMMMVIPEAWQGNDQMESYKKDFYEYHASLMEPWDGPASICFTDGEIVGATLDRNGLRPSRYCLTSEDKLVMASEAGALPVDESKVILKGRLQPGKMFVADLNQGRIISDEELKQDICKRKPYDAWLQKHKIHLKDIAAATSIAPNPSDLLQQQLTFGYSQEDLKLILGPLVEKAAEPVGSMGADIPLAVLSGKRQHMANYFKQLFAQVSNPPIDPIREKMVMSLFTKLGSNLNVLSETPEHCQELQLDQPVLNQQDFEKLVHLDHPNFKSVKVDTLFDVDKGPKGLENAIDQVCQQVAQAVRNGVQIIILSDQGTTKNLAAIPSLLITGAVHHYLIDQRLRAAAGIVVASGDVIETHHFATLIGYGANAIYPYLSMMTIAELAKSETIYGDPDQAITRYVAGIDYGLLKIFSKMGISTLQSYQGAQIFEILGLNSKVVDKCFKDSISRIGGIGFEQIAVDVLGFHQNAFESPHINAMGLPEGGVYQWKKEGEFHLFNPKTIHYLQNASRRNDYGLYKKFAELINNQQEQACTLRGLFKFKKRTPVPVEEVEPVEGIFRRFATGAMSFGSISHEAHATLAVAMNRIGGKSNSGEGGEDEIRFERKPNGDWERSAIKQVASGRFGVTSNYLTNAAELQIKMAQGAKPGEGGQLPGHKVDDWIGRVRHSTPGVGLISPPPHHDIYSIEDLKQLIFDLKNANRQARINVKLVAEAGVGTIAAGVAKAKADVILIAGHDGGTGASPISSIRHAGLPWELGLAEAHQTLVKNKLRNRVVLQTDGQIRTGRDLAIATLLGAEEWGVATAALVVEGCILMRKCHLNTCPVGIATQNPELRQKFAGDPQHVVNYFAFLAQDLREIMAELGFRSVNEMVGQADVLEARKDIDDPKLQSIDLSPILYQEHSGAEAGLYHQIDQDHEMDHVLDWILLKAAKRTLDLGTAYQGSFDIINTDRAVGALLSNEISKKYGSEGLPQGRLHFNFKGSAGQSFGAFVAPGVRFELEGEANDYFGKGLSGGQLIIYPHNEATYAPRDNMIIGNVAFYGATSGEAYIRGLAGERFAVRNSGVTAVVEGVGDHGCEYMTGGTIVVLGETGRNFAAGMSGGVAYVYDPKAAFAARCNQEMVDLDPFAYEDISLVKKLINNHYEFTKSDVAIELLQDWDTACNHFIKVMPRDYKRVLQQRKQLEQASWVMGKITGFLDYQRETPHDRAPKERLKDWKEFHLGMPEEKLKDQGARCMDCGVPFCHTGTLISGMASGCPINNLIPDWNDLVYQGKWQEALKLLLKTNNFPEFTGRVCPAPCEGSCVLGINEPPVTIKNIEYSIIEKGFAEGWIKPQPPKVRTDKKVAVIGSGPAGLACADQLNKAGHLVTVYERADRVGGLLMYGIPNMKLDKEKVVDRRVDLMKKEGIQFKTNSEVGVNLSARELLDNYDALVLCTGSTNPRDLPVSGRELQGVHFAMDFLQANTKSLLDSNLEDQQYISAEGKNVIVIGGGDTGTDCVATSLRHGCESLQQLEILDKPPLERASDNPWPEWPKVYYLDYGQEEAKAAFGDDPRQYCSMTKKFVGNEAGQVKEIHLVTIKWEQNEEGRYQPREIPGTEKVLKADLVLLAMGYLGPEPQLLQALQVATNDQNNIKADYGKFTTNVEKVFAAGDARRGQSLVVWAINEGRAAARECDKFLTGQTYLP